MNKFISLLHCTPFDLWILFQATIFLPIIKYCLKRHGYSRTQQFIIRCSRRKSGYRNPSPVTNSNQARRIARMVRVAANFLPTEINCLPKSLAIYGLLQRQGIEGDLRIGVRFDKGKFAAHAWVEHLGIALNSAADMKTFYTSFDQPALTR